MDRMHRRDRMDIIGCIQGQIDKFDDVSSK